MEDKEGGQNGRENKEIRWQVVEKDIGEMETKRDEETAGDG